MRHSAAPVDSYRTHLLPVLDDVFVSQQPRPRQSGDSVFMSERFVALEQLRGLVCESVALLDEVVSYQTEGAVGQHARANVEVSGIAGAEPEGTRGEAVLGDVLVGGRQKCLLGAATKSTFGGRVVVGVVASRAALFAQQGTAARGDSVCRRAGCCGGHCGLSSLIRVTF